MTERRTPLLPYAFARERGVIATRNALAGQIEVLLHPTAVPATLAEVARVLGRGLILVEQDEAGFAQSLAATYRDSASDASAAAADSDLASIAESVAIIDDLLDQNDDAPVVRLINALILEAIRERASDIHIEPQERRLVVRLRIDGMLREILEPARRLAPLLVSWIKIMAALDIAERRLPQDGRVSLRVGGHEVDVRVSTLPSQHGERVVMRLLDRNTARLGLAALGMSDADAMGFQKLLARPNGMLLVTGPTGSGKTTTLYAALDQMNDRSRNIITVEDPIEYTLEGIGQVHVRARGDMTFARGLRAILRQDPDVIMVGEIRDSETAHVAAEAAMTGHFVMSTLHTNTAVGAVTRLIDMGVERYVLAPMLAGIIAQRLVRRLCPECRQMAVATAAEAALMPGFLAVGDPVWHPVGCNRCAGQGYLGRAAIYEVVTVSREMQGLIYSGAGEAEIEAAARQTTPSLVQDGLRLVRDGITSVSEVARVAQEE